MTPTPDRQLDDLLRNFAHQAQEDYPALKGRLLVFDARRQRMFGEFIMSDFQEPVAAILRKNVGNSMDLALASQGSFASELAYMTGGRETIVAGSFISYGHGHDPFYGIEVLRNGQSPAGIYRILYHELGHRIAANEKDDFPLRHFCETTCDVYSLIRIYKEFGREACHEQAELLYKNRINLVIEGQFLHHFSVPAIKAFLNVADQIDFDALTLNDTRQLARRLAFDNHMPENALKEFSLKFSDFRQDITRLPLHEAAKKIAEKALTDNDSVFIGTVQMIARKLEAGPALLSALRLHEIRVEKEGLLCGIPKAKSPLLTKIVPAPHP